MLADLDLACHVMGIGGFFRMHNISARQFED